MKTKFALIILVVILVASSIYKGEVVTSGAVGASNYIVNLYDSIVRAFRDNVNEHFRQAQEIQSLRTQNAELEKSAILLATFATELNQILRDKNVSLYAPQTRLVKALSYVTIGDYDKIWLEKFEDFNTSKIYGLIYQGKSVGIAVSKNDQPLALLQTDPKSIFSVYIGQDKIPGVAHGNKNSILVKFIPQWLTLKEGDEVFTSGLDGIFFSGVPVGRVSRVFKESSYQSAIVEPHIKPNIPTYLYIVTKEK